ncbi:MAG: GrpB-like predicted nucleotidyltransferase (UPF0157 family) [Myxococcota bacterium]|jgi:GrpB-like predicted nucleotidyltransferase (UPF0157 family)
MDEIELHPYDPSWPPAYDREAASLHGSLSAHGHARSEILHIGSTAVPGLAAKPIIDIMLVVPDLAIARSEFPAVLDALGYDFWADGPDPARLFFVKGMPPRGPKRTHHVHVVAPEPAVLKRHVGFRDYLRAHPDIAAEYGRLKQGLATAHRNDREAYTKAKNGFVERVLTLIDGEA